MWKTAIIICGIIFCLTEVEFCQGSIAVCITNCVQCKQMFGRYFQGKACGDACILSNGKETPDCNNPGTLSNFLKRLV